VTLTTSAFAAQGRTHVLYTLAANGGPVRGELALCVRPFQVDPPWQFLNAPGGLAMVKQIAAVEHGWRIGERDAVFIPTGWTGRAALRFDEGEAAARLVTAGKLGGGHNDAEDEHGAASAAAVYPFDLQAGERRSLLVEAGPFEGGRAEAGRTGAAAAEFAAIRELQKGDWAGLDRVRMSLPPGNEQLVASVRASLAYILINKDGPGFQPGSRSYERSWMRDGALTSAALLEFGMAEEVKGFIEWYAGYQFPDGAVPCVVDRRGADPVVENDSHGQFVYALAEYHRFTGDDAFVTKHFGAAEKAVAHIQSERAKRMTAEYRGEGSRAEPGKAAAPLAAFYGLMPESISHEGYSAKPMHSYWDDFFTLKGLRDAAYLARVLKKGERAAAFASAAEDMAACIKRSIELTRRAHGIAYIPGCVELGDFDATSTTVAVNPCGVLNVLPREWVDETFERWWSFFEARRDGRVEWEDYTPYEWRIVGSLVTLGQRERAWEAAKWFMRDQNPARKEGDTSASGWLHWAEIVHKDRGAGKWIGDMPHTWVASDFLRSV
ncbi:MAG: hypothetical protein K2Q09_10190, partial [Phycisphaerales bacterium]|nr:hypothetical protein [Phycisphaerales bacterium]